VSGAFEVDFEAQAQSLRDFDRAPVCLGIYPLLRVRHERIVLTGMGASHFAALPAWRRLVACGRPTWWIDAGRLLDSPELVTADTLLVATSRSGRCGELVALVEKIREMKPQAAIVAVTDDAASPLAGGADGEILLRSASSGDPKGFLNVLAAHDYIAALILDEDSDDIAATARVVAATTVPAFGDAVAAAANPRSRLAFIGFQQHAATALYAGLLASETTGVAAEAYIGGQFRHGPARAANTDLTAVVLSGRDATANAAARRLATDLVAAGSTVMVVGDVAIDGVLAVPSPDAHLSAQVAHGVVIVEQFVSTLARARPLPAPASD
jgi:glutamine---fructose-6-phosphate transaminase (isomerizing)